MQYDGVIFDLDGVIVTTDNCHYLAWKMMADSENIYFDRKINERLRGVSRMESLDIILEQAKREYSMTEKSQMATIKNDYYKGLIEGLSRSDVLPGVMEYIHFLKDKSIKIAIGSSSKNAKPILRYIDMENIFDAICDGNDIVKSKPHPEVFIKASDMIGIHPSRCLVVEDAEAGILAAVSGGMTALAVGTANGNLNAKYSADSLADELCYSIFE